MPNNNSTPRVFSMSQELLYMIALIAWALCRRYLPDFKQLKALYTDQFVDDAVKAVNNAKNIADQQQRNIMVQDKREQLDTSAATFLEMWQTLKRYITTAFAKSQQSQQFLNAGLAKYEAAKTNMEDLQKFIETSMKYVGNNVSRLQQNDNMPGTFEAEFKTLGDACIQLIDSVLHADNTRKTETIDKNEADNAIYQSLVVMLQDGQQLFKTIKKDKALARQFVLSQLLKLARANRPAKLKGYVYDSVTGKPLQDAVVRTATGDYSTTTTKKGRYDIARILGGTTYLVQVVHEGYSTIELEVTIKPGIGKTIKFQLVPVAEQTVEKAA